MRYLDSYKKEDEVLEREYQDFCDRANETKILLEKRKEEKEKKEELKQKVKTVEQKLEEIVPELKRRFEYEPVESCLRHGPFLRFYSDKLGIDEKTLKELIRKRF